ncbi:MAG: hypothetical protein ACKVJU_09375 [Verrucomicrobiales bacterium]
MDNSQSFWLRPAVLKAYLLFFCIGVVVVSLGRPDHIWDTISYTSLAKEKDFESVEALHKEAFDSLIAAVGEERFQSMLGQHHPKFRQAMYENSEVFKQQLNFFRTRLLFTNTVRLINKTTGISPRVGGTVVAGICAALGLWVMAMLFFQKVPRTAVYLFPIVGILFGVISLGRASSPDGMSFLFIALNCYFFFKGPKWVLLLMLPLAVAARTDAIVWAGLMGGYLFLTQKGFNRWGSVLAILLSYATYKYANHAAGQYDWGVLIQNAFWEPLLLPGEADGVITVARYAKILAVGIGTIIVEKELLVYLVLLIWFLAMVFVKHGLKGRFWQVFRNPWIGFIAISLAYIAAHFVLFPMLWYRFFIVPYIFMAFLFIASAKVGLGAIEEDESTRS